MLFPLCFSDAKTQTIDALFTAMRDRYVSLADAERAERAIRAKLAAHGYDLVEDDAFARALTSDLQATIQDAHLGVRYSPVEIPLLPDPTKAQRWMAKMNGGFARVERLRGNVGYLRFDGFAPVNQMRGPMKAAMDFLSGTDTLIVDLRENHGGEPEAVRHADSYFFGRRTHVNDFWWRKGARTEQVWTTRVPGRVYAKPVYVLVGPRSASAAEEFAYDLQALKRATIVGTPTWGGANPGDDVRLGPHFAAYVSTGRAVNPVTKSNWEGTGVQPDVRAEDALATAHRLAVRGLIAEEKDSEMRTGLERTLRDLGGKA